MKSCRELIAIKVVIPLNDDNGVFLDPSSVTYSLQNSDGTIASVYAPVDTFLQGDVSVEVDITGTLNTILFEADGITQKDVDFKTVILSLTLSTGEIFFITDNYLVTKEKILLVMKNSYQLLVNAEMMALDMRVPYWKSSTIAEKRLAMIESFEKLGKYGYEVRKSKDIKCTEVRTIVNINFMDEIDFVDLPEDFTRALKRAQIIESNSILESEFAPVSYASKLAQGIVSETVGESSVTLKQTVGVSYRLNSATMRELAGFISNARKTGRA